MWQISSVPQLVEAFVSGTHSIIFKWAEFTSGLARDLDFNPTGGVRNVILGKGKYTN